RLSAGPRGYNLGLPEDASAVTKPMPKRKPAPAPAKSSVITIAQKVTLSWKAKGKTYFRYSTAVTNKSTKNLKNVKLSVSKLYGPLWGLKKSGSSYILGNLPARKSVEIVYVHAAPPAYITVANYN
ncbi:hypothetical protein MKW98_026013, partial [Papaver atlanticum]